MSAVSRLEEIIQPTLLKCQPTYDGTGNEESSSILSYSRSFGEAIMKLPHGAPAQSEGWLFWEPIRPCPPDQPLGIRLF